MSQDMTNLADGRVPNFCHQGKQEFLRTRWSQVQKWSWEHLCILLFWTTLNWNKTHVPKRISQRKSDLSIYIKSNDFTRIDGISRKIHLTMLPRIGGTGHLARSAGGLGQRYLSISHWITPGRHGSQYTGPDRPSPLLRVYSTYLRLDTSTKCLKLFYTSPEPILGYSYFITNVYINIIYNFYNKIYSVK